MKLKGWLAVVAVVSFAVCASGELRFTNGLASNGLRFEYEGEGSAYVAKVAQEAGALLIGS